VKKRDIIVIAKANGKTCVSHNLAAALDTSIVNIISLNDFSTRKIARLIIAQLDKYSR